MQVLEQQKFRFLQTGAQKSKQITFGVCSQQRLQVRTLALHLWKLQEVISLWLHRTNIYIHVHRGFSSTCLCVSDTLHLSHIKTAVIVFKAQPKFGMHLSEILNYIQEYLFSQMSILKNFSWVYTEGGIAGHFVNGYSFSKYCQIVVLKQLS